MDTSRTDDESADTGREPVVQDLALGDMYAAIESMRAQLHMVLEDKKRTSEQAEDSAAHESASQALGEDRMSPMGSTRRSGRVHQQAIRVDEFDRRLTFDAPKGLVEEQLYAVPKALRTGNITVKFSNTRYENIKSFLRKVEGELRLTSRRFWVDLTILALGETVKATVTRHGMMLPEGRMKVMTSSGYEEDCPAGWYDWDEFKSFMLEKYSRPTSGIETIWKLLYTNKQTKSFEQYVNDWQHEYTNWDGPDLPEEFIKAVYLHQMRTPTKDALMKKPRTMTVSLDDFITEACLTDDVLYRQSTSAAVEPARGKALALSEAGARPEASVEAKKNSEKNM